MHISSVNQFTNTFSLFLCILYCCFHSWFNDWFLQIFCKFYKGDFLSNQFDISYFCLIFCFPLLGYQYLNFHSLVNYWNRKTINYLSMKPYRRFSIPNHLNKNLSTSNFLLAISSTTDPSNTVFSFADLSTVPSTTSSSTGVPSTYYLLLTG